MTEYAFFVNHEARVAPKPKIKWDSVKKMWEGNQFINMKYGGLVCEEYTYRMPFIYLFNQPYELVWKIIENDHGICGDELTSLRNRVIHI